MNFVKQLIKQAGLHSVPPDYFETEMSAGRKKLFNLTDLQAEVAVWTKNIFGKNRPPHQPFMGLVEELGELSHAHLKQEQQVRLNEDHTAKKIDAVGDIIIYLADYCNLQEIDLNEALLKVWQQVRKRTQEEYRKGMV